MVRRCFIMYALSGKVPSVSTYFGATDLTDTAIKHRIFIHCKHFQVSCLTDASMEDAAGIKGTLSRIAHFITDNKSKTLHTGLLIRNSDGHLVPFGRGERTDSSTHARLLNVLQNQVTSGAFSVILEDASIILRPRMVTGLKGVIEPDGSGNITPESHPNETVLRVLSDMARLYGRGDFGRATSHKLGYYAARVVCMPAVTLRVLADEVLARSKLIVLESGGGSEQTEGFFSPSTRTTPVLPRPIIEEL